MCSATGPVSNQHDAHLVSAAGVAGLAGQLDCHVEDCDWPPHVAEFWGAWGHGGVGTAAASRAGGERPNQATL